MKVRGDVNSVGFIDCIAVSIDPAFKDITFLGGNGQFTVSAVVGYGDGGFIRNCDLFSTNFIDTDIVDRQLVAGGIGIKSDLDKCCISTCRELNIRLCICGLTGQGDINIAFPVCTVCCVRCCSCFTGLICIQSIDVNIITA